jgi:hypothetical protein
MKQPFLCLILMFLAATSASATTYYVAASGGSDSNNCTQAQSTSTPKLTLASAFGCVTASNGDTIQMRGGTYAVGLIDPPSGTSYANALTITNFSGETVTINGIDTDPALWMTGLHTYIIIKGDVPCSSGSSCHFVVDAGCNVSMANRALGTDCPSASGNAIKWTSVSNGTPTPNHIRLENMELRNSRFSGIQTADRGTANEGFFEFLHLHVHDVGTRANLDHGFYLESPSNRVEYCDSHDNAAYGLQFDNGPTNNSIVRFNKIHDNAQIPGGGGGIYCADSTGTAGGTLMYNNLIYNNASYGIQLRCPTSKFYNNTFYHNGNINLYIEDQTANSLVRNNIASGASGGVAEDVRLEGSVNVTFENNLVGSSSLVRIGDTGTVLNNNLLSSNPLFVSTGTPDLHLTSSSPARGAGQNLSSDFTSDYDGVARPGSGAWDIGAFQFASGSNTPRVNISGKTVISGKALP